MQHIWKEGPPVYCGQVGWDTFEDCAICGLGRVYAVEDAYTILRGHPMQFSSDCTLAQEQLRFYLLGWLKAAADIDRIRYGLGLRIIVPAIQNKTASLLNILRAVRMLEKACPFPEDLEVELQGGRPAPQEPLLDVEL